MKKVKTELEEMIDMQETGASCKFFDNLKIPEPAVFVIFGASGNLTAIKLFPALYSLVSEGRVSSCFRVLGFSRTPLRSGDFREKMKQCVVKHGEIKFEPHVWEKFSRNIHYQPGDPGNPDDFIRLADRIKSMCEEQDLPQNVILYLATPPGAYHKVVENLEKTRFTERIPGWCRIVVEKPFGNDLKSADDLNEKLSRVFDESRIYRIDHYLGKETVQNILVFRFANGMFEPVWNRLYIDHVQILIAEKIGIEKRGGYYEKAGALKDMVQNHMMQLLALTAMEPPVAFDSGPVRDEKVKVIRSIRPVACEEVAKISARGQYCGAVINGKKIPGYREEHNVAPDSKTETYAALKICIDNWRWAGVPFYLRTGKRLPRKATEIAIFFKQAPHLLFQRALCDEPHTNILVLRIQPDEGIFLRFGAKIPGAALQIGNVDMNFNYDTFPERKMSAYERLLLDILQGDSSLFARRDGIEAMWKFTDSISAGWKECGTDDFPNYTAGSWGPESADDLIRRDGRQWRIP